MTDTLILSWVHLSDLHFGRSDSAQEWDQKMVLESLRVDVAERLKDLAKDKLLPAIDTILVTGDIAFSGGVNSEDEYIKARKFLTEMAATAKISKDQIYLVPGNHDVQRNFDKVKDIKRLVEALRRSDEDIDEALADTISQDDKHKPDKEKLCCRFTNYLKLASEFGPGRAAKDGKSAEQRLWWTTQLNPHGNKIRLMGLNSAILSAEPDDRGKLRLGKRMLAEAFVSTPIERDEIVLLLTHHPLSGGWLADEKDANDWIRSHAHIHLCGHTHESHSVEVRSGSGGHIVRIAAGSAYDRKHEGIPSAHGYCIAAIFKCVDGSLALRIWSRKWSTNKAKFAWDRDNAPDGKNYAEHVLRNIETVEANQIATVGESLHNGSPGTNPAPVGLLRKAKWFGVGALFEHMMHFIWGSKVLVTTGALIVIAGGAAGTAVAIDPQLPGKVKQTIHEIDVRATVHKALARLRERHSQPDPPVDFGLPGFPAPLLDAASVPDLADMADLSSQPDMNSANLLDMTAQSPDADTPDMPDLNSSATPDLAMPSDMAKQKRHHTPRQLLVPKPVVVPSEPPKKPAPAIPAETAKEPAAPTEDYGPKDIWELACWTFVPLPTKYSEMKEIVRSEKFSPLADKLKIATDDENLFYKVIEKISGLKFAKSYDKVGGFMHLNPRLIDWVEENFVKNPRNGPCFRKVYTSSFQLVTRTHAAAFLVMEDSDFFQKFVGKPADFKADYVKFCANISELDRNIYNIKTAEKDAVERTCLFWLRRKADGTHIKLAKLLKAIIQQYDKKFYEQFGSKLP